LIAGARGRNKINVDSIAATLVSLGRLLEEQPLIEQVDLNPCLPLDDCCMAVDARIILSKQEHLSLLPQERPAAIFADAGYA
jgi:hypothetical protein